MLINFGGREVESLFYLRQRCTVLENTFFLFSGTLLFIDEKIRQSAALFWFGLRVVGILQGKFRKFSVEHKLTHTQSRILIHLVGGRGEILFDLRQRFT
jgi:hypothetical protein